MHLTAPWRILLLNGETPAQDELRAVLAASADESHDSSPQFEIDIAPCSSAADSIRQAMQANQPYALAWLEKPCVGDADWQCLADVLQADADIPLILRTPGAQRVPGIIASADAQRVYRLTAPGVAADMRQLVLALCRNGQLARDARAERLRIEDALRSSQDRYALAVAGSNDGIWDWNVESGLVFYSNRWKEMLGHADSEIGPTLDEWLSRVHPDDLPQVQAELDAHLAGRTDNFRAEYRMKHKNETYHWFQTRGVAIRDAAGRVRRAAGSQTEITDRKLAEEQLRHDALHDSLTGLANRALLLDRMSHCVQRAKRNPDYQFAVLFLDVDRFKVINDSLGHDAGDQLLVEIATRILSVVRGLDTVARVEADQLARLGGDEFVLLLDPIGHTDDAVRVAERLLKALAEPFRFGPHEVATSVSMGISVGNAQTVRPENLLRDADAALHDAKTDHKQRYRIYNPEMHARAMKRLSMEGELRQAIERDHLRLFYQPIHSLGTGRIVEFEALVRWQHPERGMIPPVEFIPLAEETGLIVPLGTWVLRTACRQLAQWFAQNPGTGEFGVGVNVSGRQFGHAELVAEVRNVLRDTGIDPRRLSLEITESALMEGGAPVMSILPSLHSLGLRLHLDDFGTGYSSLGYLNQMPIDVLKIDRSFVSRIGAGKTGRSIVQAIIALARSLDMEVIAEGVENESQVAILTGMGCDCVQGFYYSRPICATEAWEYWQRTVASLPLPATSEDTAQSARRIRAS
jgi:diguanylate cyclase (GGDEF)-like protein/PAS domain S-box-containing protein